MALLSMARSRMNTSGLKSAGWLDLSSYLLREADTSKNKMAMHGQSLVCKLVLLITYTNLRFAK